jgi:hypothetical protein
MFGTCRGRVLALPHGYITMHFKPWAAPWTYLQQVRPGKRLHCVCSAELGQLCADVSNRLRAIAHTSIVHGTRVLHSKSTKTECALVQRVNQTAALKAQLEKAVLSGDIELQKLEQLDAKLARMLSRKQASQQLASKRLEVCLPVPQQRASADVRATATIHVPIPLSHRTCTYRIQCCYA